MKKFKGSQCDQETLIRSVEAFAQSLKIKSTGEEHIVKVVLFHTEGGLPFRCTFCRDSAEYTLHLVMGDGTLGEILGDYCKAHADAVSQEIQKGTLKVQAIAGA